MYRKILAAVNEHVNSEVSARYALAFARAAGGKFFLCHVADPAEGREALAHAEGAMERLFELAREEGVEAEAITETGTPARVLGSVVLKEHIDLVFTATRHRDMRGRLFEGTVSKRLFLGLPCAVALVHVMRLGRIHPREVLVPLKERFGHIEERARFVSTMARAFGSRVVIFHAARPVDRFFEGEVHLGPLDLEDRVSGDIRSFSEALARNGVEHGRRLATGAPARTITIEAARKHADLIVLGSSERGLVKSLIGGRPLDEILRASPCDLMIFRPRHGH